MLVKNSVAVCRAALLPDHQYLTHTVSEVRSGGNLEVEPYGSIASYHSRYTAAVRIHIDYR